MERRRNSGTAVLGAVLAGGAGSRLGGAKATAGLAGRPLISYPLAAFAAAGIEAVVVAKAGTELPDFAALGWAGEGGGVPAPGVLIEPEGPRHPLAGIVAALGAAGGRPLVVLACDMPLASPALLAALAAAPEPLVVPSPGGLLEPLQARYTAPLLPALEAALAAQAPLRQTVAGLSPRLLGEAELSRFGPVDRLFFNVNRTEDLALAETLL